MMDASGNLHGEGGRFAASRSAEQVGELSGWTSTPQAPSQPSVTQALHLADAAELHDFTNMRAALSRLPESRVRAIASELDNAARKARRYEDPDEVYGAPPEDLLVDDSEFQSSSQDRLEEDATGGVDFNAWADALSQAWRDETLGIAQAALAENAASTVRRAA